MDIILQNKNILEAPEAVDEISLKLEGLAWKEAYACPGVGFASGLDTEIDRKLNKKNKHTSF